MQLHELANVVFRWAHLVAGIMWIGNSMLFNWLDRNLVKARPVRPERGGEAAESNGRLSQGKIYMVHSGAFYEVEKKLLEPGEMPDQLHWFKWQNGFTWMTGIALLVVTYFLKSGEGYLVDPSVRVLGQGEAIAISVGSLIAAWAIYDTLWRTLGKRAPVVATALSFVLLFGAAYAFTLVFSGRAAYMQTGVLIGTIMTGNVWMRILPSQRDLIAATKSGKEQDATLSIRAKQRSIHNNYLTFPLLFIMVSNHFPSTYGTYLNWLVLFAVMVGGAGVRHFMNVRYDGKLWLAPAFAMAGIGIAGMMIVTRIHRPPTVVIDKKVGFARVQEIIVARCTRCHSAHPTDGDFHVAPNNVQFDTAERIQAMAARIKDRVYTNRTMPFLNRTNITDAERAELAAWVDQGAKLE